MVMRQEREAEYPVVIPPAPKVIDHKPQIGFSDAQYQAIAQAADRWFGGNFTACVRVAVKASLDRWNQADSEEVV